MNKIKTIARPAEKKVTGCGECRSTCQSACKTSCTVGNQSCERISRENCSLNYVPAKISALITKISLRWDFS